MGMEELELSIAELNIEAFMSARVSCLLSRVRRLYIQDSVRPGTKPPACTRE